MKLPDFDPLDERYRWCVFCGADCWPDPEHQEHADDCPTVTGKYPVDANHPGVPDEAKRDGMRCGRCEREITTTYRHIEIESGDGRSMATAPVYECVCEDCALVAEFPVPVTNPKEPDG